jgi:hypothetical protein
MYIFIRVFTYKGIFSLVLSLIQMNICAQPKVTAHSLFDTTRMGYKGSDSQQVSYLLKNIGMWGLINHEEETTPNTFHQLAGKKCNVTKEIFELYLVNNRIATSDLGGPLHKNVSFIVSGREKIFARYFVIHDVSSPPYRDKFPSNIDSATWPWNNKKRYTAKKNHVYITRTGESTTVVDFSTGWRATKMELQRLGKKSRGLFLHIEMVQPRVFPPGNEVSAPIAPNPGFTDLQYDRLALVYMAASIRRGRWLIPAYHAVIDEGIFDGHDDPQHFDLTKWSRALDALLGKLE